MSDQPDQILLSMAEYSGKLGEMIREKLGARGVVPDHRAMVAEPRDVNGDLCRCCHTMLEICEDRFKRAVQGDPLPHLRPPFQTYGDFRRGNDR